MFPVEINFIAGPYDEFLQYIADYHNKIMQPDCNIAETHYIDGIHYIWFEENTITIPIMIHELGHVVFNVMHCLGIELTDQEFFCYTQEYLFEQIYKYVHSLHRRSV